MISCAGPCGGEGTVWAAGKEGKLSYRSVCRSLDHLAIQPRYTPFRKRVRCSKSFMAIWPECLQGFIMCTLKKD